MPTRATRPPGRRASTSGTAKACSIRAAVPVTGINRPSGVGRPTSSPTEVSHFLTAATVGASAPKVAANWAVLR